MDSEGEDSYRIVGLVKFGSEDESRGEWRQVGNARKNRDGSLELQFAAWPSNIDRLQVRASDSNE